MPESFSKHLLQQAQLLKFDAGQVIFQPGDAAGGFMGWSQER